MMRALQAGYEERNHLIKRSGLWAKVRMESGDTNSGRRAHLDELVTRDTLLGF